ncbi:transcription factor PAP1-domain-containing protein [Thelonectria olida]|uniref:Transcription factor PAP1-domain-containing protein n=1 Tax=Thelonectria olida TaxID=1576542 RepID=A0A9P8W9Z1_9HYPO|nr:transcription factor PAP1-domain-containing protein [Thelonectria olida]
MASTGTGGSLPPNFLLTPQQQSLLFAALNSNKQQLPASNAPNSISLSPTSFQTSPAQSKPSHHQNFQESPFLDNYDYDFGDSSFDFSFASNADENATLIGDLPDSGAKSNSSENEGNEKRSHPDDEDDADTPGNDPKRRESTEKVSKKPGRKPLTSEPTSRKAQNRAAQRAFRERKERHLKDLETKVEELEKASEAANHENGLLRAQVERMTTELNQYKQRVNVMTNTKSLPREKVPFGSAAINNLSDVNFQFEFPKFGMLPGPPSSKLQKSGSNPTSPHQQVSATTPSSALSNGNSPQTQFKDDLAKFSGVFSPSMSSSATNASRASMDSANFSVNGATSSPSASSHSNGGPSSSCGTSPEPFTQSPMGFKPVETLTTIGEEHPSISTGDNASRFSNIDLGNTNFDWLAHQNGGQFDPQLFGDYREPQDNVLNNPSFDDFFNDALDTDFITPFNMAPSPNVPKSSVVAPKKNLIAEIDAQQNSVDDEPLAKKDQNMNCNELWEKLQACPNAQNGEFDLDGLCQELTKKAKCSGTGPVVGETDFDTILSRFMGKDVSKSCMAAKLGVEIQADDKTHGLPSAV